MTPFKAMSICCAMSKHQISQHFDVNINTVKMWLQGKKEVPPNITIEMMSISAFINAWADDIKDHIDGNDNVATVEYCTNDNQAQELDFPFKSCHDLAISIGYENLSYNNISVTFKEISK